MSIEAIKLMVHELEYVLDCINKDKIPFDGDDFHEALRLGRQAIEQAEKQEPVAYINIEQRKLEWAKYTKWDTPTVVNLPKIPLYTTPQPQREWVGLTDDEIALLCGECAASAHNWNDISFARAIEQALKEKNT